MTDVQTAAQANAEQAAASAGDQQLPKSPLEIIADLEKAMTKLHERVQSVEAFLAKWGHRNG